MTPVRDEALNRVAGKTEATYLPMDHSNIYTLWCQVEGEGTRFKVKVHPDEDINDLRAKIYEYVRNGSFRDCDAKDLELLKVRRHAQSCMP
jgi:hypothetical protein